MSEPLNDLIARSIAGHKYVAAPEQSHTGAARQSAANLCRIALSRAEKSSNAAEMGRYLTIAERAHALGLACEGGA